MRLTFEEALKRAEFAASQSPSKYTVCLINGEYMAVVKHVAKDHRYRILCETI